MRPHEHIILPLDFSDIDQAVRHVELMRNEVGVFKVGLELMHSQGFNSDALHRLRAAGADRIFVDAKLHDIPNTVAGAMRGIASKGAWCVTVHTTGGAAMLRRSVQAAAEEADRWGLARPLILGVTVLTSIGDTELKNEMKVERSMSDYAVDLAMLAHDCGCDGVIASPIETEAVRSSVPSKEFLIVTPGVRPVGAEPGDQSRILTPAAAMLRGANYLVIGRPINDAPDPVAAARTIAREIEGVWNLV